MGKDVKGFLKAYFNQMQFNHMADNGGGQLKQFSEWVKKDELTAEMEDWVKKYAVLDAHTKKPTFDPNTGNIVLKAVPKINGTGENDLDTDQQEKLFLKLQKVFANLYANKSSLSKNSDAINLLNKYFGPHSLFRAPKATNECEAGINEIVNLLKNNPDIKKYVISNTQTWKDGRYVPSFSEEDFDNLLKDCSNQKYNSDLNVRNKIINVAQTLASSVSIGGGLTGSEAATVAACQKVQAIQNHLDIVTSDDAFAFPAIDTNQMNWFIDSAGNDILEQVYKNENISSAFEEHGGDDGADIVKHKKTALKDIAHNDEKGDNYVPPVITDKLNAKQQIAKWARNTYKDSFKKYEQLRGGKIFLTAEAKDIFDAVDNAKIKPTDGLDGMLKKASDIKSTIKNPKAKQHFQWFIDTMGPIQKAMPKAVEGAWRNGQQQKAVIDQIILNAVKTEPGKAPDPAAIEKAKTAMQIMQAMKYGMLTSKVMDALGKEDFTLFSDGGLSWNKNEGIKFVTTALDKSVKAAFMTVGYGITFVDNAISMKKGRKYNNKYNQNNSQMRNAIETEEERRANDKSAFLASKPLKDAYENNEITQQRRKLGDLSRKGINDTTIESKTRQQQRDKADLDNFKTTRLNPQQTIMDQNKEKHDKYETNQNLLHTIDIPGKQNDIHNKEIDKDNKEIIKDDKQIEIFNKQAVINLKIREINDPATIHGLSPADANSKLTRLNAELTRFYTELDTLKSEYNTLESEYNNLGTELQTLNNELAELTQQETAANQVLNDPNNLNAFNAYNNAESQYNNLKANYNHGHGYDQTEHELEELATDINDYDNATKTIKELNDAIDKRDEEKRNWDNQHWNAVLELENYWNFLQTGVENTWALSLKKAQARLLRRDTDDNGNRGKRYSIYNQRHHYGRSL